MQAFQLLDQADFAVGEKEILQSQEEKEEIEEALLKDPDSDTLVLENRTSARS